MHWFDTREGKMIVGSAAYETVIEQSSPGDIVPLAELLETDRFDDIDYSVFDRTRQTHSRTKEDFVLYGQWVLNILNTLESPPPLRKQHFERLRQLGVGQPYRNIIKKYFDDIPSLANDLERPFYSPHGTFDEWTLQDYTAYTKWLAETVGRKPRKSDFDEYARAGYGPSQNMISVKSGYTIGYFNEQLGYPNILEWELEDYVAWGAQLAQANSHTRITNELVDIVSQRDRGPSAKVIHSKFGGLVNYREAVAAWSSQNPQPEQLEPPSHYKELFPLLEDRLGDAMPANLADRLELAAKLELTVSLLPGISNSEGLELVLHTQPNQLIDMLIRENYHLTVSHIQTIANKLGCSEYIWPPQAERNARLYVSPEELTEYRTKATAVKMRWKRERKRRQNQT